MSIKSLHKYHKKRLRALNKQSRKDDNANIPIISYIDIHDRKGYTFYPGNIYDWRAITRLYEYFKILAPSVLKEQLNNICRNTYYLKEVDFYIANLFNDDYNDEEVILGTFIKKVLYHSKGSFDDIPINSIGVYDVLEDESSGCILYDDIKDNYCYVLGTAILYYFCNVHTFDQLHDPSFLRDWLCTSVLSCEEEEKEEEIEEEDKTIYLHNSSEYVSFNNVAGLIEEHYSEIINIKMRFYAMLKSMDYAYIHQLLKENNDNALWLRAVIFLAMHDFDITHYTKHYNNQDEVMSPVNTYSIYIAYDDFLKFTDDLYDSDNQQIGKLAIPTIYTKDAIYKLPEKAYSHHHLVRVFQSVFDFNFEKQNFYNDTAKSYLQTHLSMGDLRGWRSILRRRIKRLPKFFPRGMEAVTE